LRYGPENRRRTTGFFTFAIGEFRRFRAAPRNWNDVEPSGPARRPGRISPTPALDFALLAAARDGDDRAFAVLIDRHAPALLQVAYSLSRNRADAEDVVQETFLAAYRGMKRFAGRSSVKTWLTQILLRRAARAWHRARHHRGTVSLDAGGAGTLAVKVRHSKMRTQ
jgi:hypothetical protein